MSKTQSLLRQGWVPTYKFIVAILIATLKGFMISPVTQGEGYEAIGSNTGLQSYSRAFILVCSYLITLPRTSLPKHLSPILSPTFLGTQKSLQIIFLMKLLGDSATNYFAKML